MHVFLQAVLLRLALKLFYKPSFGSSLAVRAELGQNKVGAFGAVGIKHIHAGFSYRHRLWAGPLPRGTFTRLPWYFCVVVVRAGAHDAEVGARVLHPYAVTLLWIQGCFILAWHPAIIQQVQRRRGDVQHSAALRRGHLVMWLRLLGRDASSCYRLAAGPAVGATGPVAVSTFCGEDLWHSSASSAIFWLNIAAVNLVTGWGAGMGDGAGRSGKSTAGAFHGHGIYSANNYTVNKCITTIFVSSPNYEIKLFYDWFGVFFGFFFCFHGHFHLPTMKLKCPSFHWMWFFCVSALLIFSFSIYIDSFSIM